MGANAGDSPFQHPPSSMIDDGLSHEIVESRSHRRRCSIWWRKSLLEAIWEDTVMVMFFIVLAVIVGTAVAFWLFAIEPRRKIYDYDPRDYDPSNRR